MNFPELAKNAYAAGSIPVRTDRGTEYEAFAKVTHRLRSASQDGERGFPALASALHDNRRLWTLLAADVAQQGNKLPERLKAQIIYLAEFSVYHGSQVLAGKANAEPLIDVNATIMHGLRSRGPAS